MSAALSAAKKRRAPTSIQPDPVRNTAPGSTPGYDPNMSQQGGLSLQQALALIDKRLIQLEMFSKNMMQKGLPNQDIAGTHAVNKDEIVNAVMEEFQSRFDVMADEIAEMKQIVLHLQSYTMDVNKMLLNQLKDTLGDGERFTISTGNEE